MFCYYRQTARTVSEQLKAKGIKAETTEGHKGEQIDNLLRRFAPIANEVIDAETVDESIQVLVVTSSLAEGYDLQDATMLVNYDLPWTVLMLSSIYGARLTSLAQAARNHNLPLCQKPCLIRRFRLQCAGITVCRNAALSIGHLPIFQ